MATLISDRRPRANRARRCDACGCIIEVGTVYVLQFIADGGDRWQWRSHEDCDRLAAEYSDAHPHLSGPWDEADFIEWLEEEGNATPYRAEAKAVLDRYHETEEGP